jgi:hypothetical protein
MGAGKRMTSSPAAWTAIPFDLQLFVPVVEALDSDGLFWRHAMIDKRQLPLVGGCRCRVIRYKVTEAPLFSFACHCTDCQQLTSSAFSLGLAVPVSGFVLDGSPHQWQKIADSGGWSRQFTCPVCTGWTHTVTQHASRLVIVRPSTLDDHAWYRPIAQIFTRSALPWALMPLPHTYSEEFTDTGPLQASFAAADMPR